MCGTKKLYVEVLGLERYSGKSIVSTIASRSSWQQISIEEKGWRGEWGPHAAGVSLKQHSVGDRADASCMSMASYPITQPTFQTDITNRQTDKQTNRQTDKQTKRKH